MASGDLTKIPFSGSTDYRQIKISGTTSGAANTIHTASATDEDEIWLWCVNSGTAAVKLTLQKGGTTSPDDEIEKTIPGEDGLWIVLPGMMLRNSLVLKAFAGTTNVLMVDGYVIRRAA